MRTELKRGSVNQILKGTNIYEEGDMVETVSLVVKGRIHIHGRGMSLMAGSGAFLGLRDVTRGVYGLNYTAQTNAVIYVFPVAGSMDDLMEIIKTNTDYGALMVSSTGRVLTEQARIYNELHDCTQKVYEVVKQSYKRCRELAHEVGIDVKEQKKIAKLEVFEETLSVPGDKIDYYRACCKIPSDVQKAFYRASGEVCIYHVRELAGLLNQTHEASVECTDYLEKLLPLLIQDSDSLYTMVVRIATAMQNIKADNSPILKELDQIIDQINHLENLLVDKADVSVKIDREYMEDSYFALLNPGSGSAKETEGAGLALVDEIGMDASQLENTLETILEYADLGEEESESFCSLIEQFQALPDKLSTDDTARTLRRSLLKEYYPLYKKVFWKDYESDEETPRAVDLFLRYGFLSEKLLRENLIDGLLNLETSESGYGECRVFDMKEWLTAIAMGEREPSKSEFDLDYEESLREKKKTKEITQEQYEKLQKNKKQKVDFEIDNMFKVNHRLVNGQISTFVPFLYTEGCASSLERMFLSKDQLNAAINRIRKVDFSAFYRESLYTKEVPGINREFIQQEVCPDLIVMPTAGNRGIMWQELSGRDRGTPGRFLFPAFLEGDLDKLMIYLVGCFRWELCRTMQGAHWNDIQTKSLTSEYSDFLQFYRKNKDLSDEKKEKLKLLIQKNRNNSRDIFASDYGNWMHHEAKGGIVLSKPVREIMATYCPFALSIRQSVEEQPIFRDAMARFNRERAKKSKEYDLKMRVWQKDNVKVPKQIKATIEFYREM